MIIKKEYKTMINKLDTILLNQFESELKAIKRQKRSDLNFYDYSNCDYYDNQILELNKKIKELKDNHNIKQQLNKKEAILEKIYYKDIDLSKRDFEIIDNKKIYKPLYIYIYEKDILNMLDDMYKFYSKRRHELYTLYNGNKSASDNEINLICEHISDVSRLKSSVRFGSYKNHIIKFEKDERPSREDYTEILFYISVDGYIPHCDILEIK